MDAQLILTLGLSLIITNATTMILGPMPRGIKTAYATEAFAFGGMLLNQARSYAFIMACLLAVVVFLFLQRTDLGKALRAAADDPEAAAYMAISVPRMHGTAFAIGIGLVAAAGGLLATYHPIEPTVGVNFIILLLVLHRILYKPLVSKMEERTSAIQKSLEEAQAARTEAARQLEENATRLRSAYQEAASIREQALKAAADEQRKLVEAAQAEARRLLDSARAQTEADIRRAREELRREVAGIAVAVAEKLVRKSLRDEDHRRIIDEAISKIGA